MHYWVIAPDLYSYPHDPYHCVALVDAPSKRAAKIAAIQSPNMRHWVDYQREDGCNPFTGLEVESAVCPHGKCLCDICQEECVVCEERVE